jgi:molybdopterin molybdotransferase
MSDVRSIGFEQASRLILEAVSRLPAEAVPLREVLGRAMAQDVYSELEMPGFDNSAMDGYALRAEDTVQATADHPATLHVVGRVAAGDLAPKPLNPHETVSIATGAMIPVGADAVLRLEEVMRAIDYIEIYEPVPPGRDIRRSGEDIARGSFVLSRGQDLGQAAIALLAALGKDSAQVTRRPRVAILTTGDELVPAGQPLNPGQIYNANAAGLAAQVEEAGGIAALLDVAGDVVEAIARGVKAGLECDVLVTSAGVSAGERDLIREALGRFGEIQSWRLAMRPVRPVAFGKIGETLVIGLPGNPVASFLGFELLARPAVRALGGHEQTARPSLTAELEHAIASPDGLLTFVRGVVDLDGSRTVRSAGGQGTANLGTLSRANCLIELDPDCGDLGAGSTVKVRLLDGNA